MPTIPKEQPNRPWLNRSQQGRRTSKNSHFYKSKSWRSVRNWFIKKNPLCTECSKKGLTVAGHVVDHITPINQGGSALDSSNLQTLCHSCHNKKSGKEAHKQN